MNISGIRPYAGFYEYNITRDSAIRAQQIQSVRNAERSTDPISEEIAGQSSALLNQTYSAYDYAQAYKPNETYEMKGADSDLSSLDMEQAINTMQKDQMLQQYQFFVGEQSDEQKIGMTTPDSRNIENFTI